MLIRIQNISIHRVKIEDKHSDNVTRICRIEEF
jgi:hypothetical protein